MNDLARRVEALLARPDVKARPAAPSPWPFEAPEPPDLVALYAACDGLDLADGTIVLGRGAIAQATRWIVDEKALGWTADILAIGERTDMVIARDLDVLGGRAGGGVLEAPHDGLETFVRVASGVVGYLEARLGIHAGAEAPAEIAAREACATGDKGALEAALARPFYPGAHRELAHAWLTLGPLRAREGDAAGALAAFEESVAARARGVSRGALAKETAAAWRACARAASDAGEGDLAAACALRGAG